MVRQLTFQERRTLGKKLDKKSNQLAKKFPDDVIKQAQLFGKFLRKEERKVLGKEIFA